MTDIVSVEFTEEAEEELDRLADRLRARVLAEAKKLQLYGWDVSLKQGRIEKVHGSDHIYELKIRGRGEAARALCFKQGASAGRIVIVVGCSPKSRFLKRGVLTADVGRAERRRDEWLDQHGAE